MRVVSLESIDELPVVDENKRIPAISKLNNFVFRTASLICWGPMVSVVGEKFIWRRQHRVNMCSTLIVYEPMNLLPDFFNFTKQHLELVLSIQWR